jgi:hypothetical protein
VSLLKLPTSVLLALRNVNNKYDSQSPCFLHERMEMAVNQSPPRQVFPRNAAPVQGYYRGRRPLSLVAEPGSRVCRGSATQNGVAGAGAQDRDTNSKGNGCTTKGGGLMSRQLGE